MANQAVLFFLFVVEVFLKGVTDVIQTQQTVMVKVGEDGHLSCQLMLTKDVLQVTWQKDLPEGKKNIASYNKYFGQTVIDGFQGKLEFKDAGLKNCSIVIRKVMEQDEGCYCCLFNTYPDGSLTGTTCLQLYGLTDVIQTQQTVMVKVGEDVHLSCQLMLTKDVFKVTWLKDLPEGKKNIGSYKKDSEQGVSSDFQGKVEFKDAGLKNCSIVIRKVTEQDEGCYLCFFHTYPDGNLTGTTCLYIYELHEPILQIRESNSSEETVVSCSATGRPAPTVTLNVPQQDLYFSNSSTVSVTNTNATVTVTTTAVLSGFHGNGAQVGCAVRLLSVPEIQVFKTIPAANQSSDDDHTLIGAWIPAAVIVCIAVAIIAIIVLLHKHCHTGMLRRSRAHKNQSKINPKHLLIENENQQKPQKPATSESQTPLIENENQQKPQKPATSEDAEEIKSPQEPIKNKSKTPLMEEENQEIRQQSTGRKNQNGEKPQSSFQGTVTKLFCNKQTRDAENIKTLKDECTTTPSVDKENQQIRQRTCEKKIQKQEQPKPSSPAVKCLRF